MEAQVTQEEGARTSVPVLDDVMTEAELAEITAEGLQANPERTPEQLAADAQKAQQMEAYQNYLKQQRFFQYMNLRPVPASLRNVEWGLLRFLLIIHEKAEFNHMPEIAALSDEQWYHGIITGNIHVYRIAGTNETQVNLRQQYVNHTTMLKPIVSENAAPPKKLGNRRQRRLH